MNFIRETELAALAAEIERSRLELNNLGEVLGALHPEVLAKSEQLDELILQHMKAQLKSKKPTA
ncbi:Spo0E family sporulation regulatory protein-aspartic acid phosphatase [Paenibacillus validus]|uniref:Spo0E family sporulation regulatory protein-aspartic acid phosphatase n=1 Tax=Paenibacillus validus TaxID=44253 RepID=UPI003D29B734